VEGAETEEEWLANDVPAAAVRENDGELEVARVFPSFFHAHCHLLNMNKICSFPTTTKPSKLRGNLNPSDWVMMLSASSQAMNPKS
jgi:hypothetical protein